MDYVTFVVRILLDDYYSLAEGKITHVASQETSYFRELDGAMTFIEGYLSSTAHTALEDDQPRPTSWNMSDASDADRG